MKFKIDENLSQEIAELLRSAGRDVTTAQGQGRAGEFDPRIIEIGRQEDRALVTQTWTSLRGCLNIPSGDSKSLQLLPSRPAPTTLSLRRQALHWLLRFPTAEQHYR